MNMDLEKPDRRKRRTRALLRKALMELIVEKGFDAISVQEIAERADVSRATFYLHYADKEELLSKSMQEVYDELVERAEASSPSHDDVLNAIASGDHERFCDPTDFRHVAEHADFYRVLLSEKGVASFNVMVHDYLARLLQEQLCLPIHSANVEPRLPSEMVAHAIAGAQIGVINWWLTRGQQHTPEDMARMFYMLNAFGFWWAMGVDTPSAPASAAV
jgi:AcrR family transcriptional regulator